MNNFAAIEHAKCLMVLREVTAYKKRTSGMSVCVCECALILIMYLTKVTKSQYSVRVITYINNTTTTLHMMCLLNATRNIKEVDSLINMGYPK